MNDTYVFLMTKNLAEYLKAGHTTFEEDFVFCISHKYQHKEIHFISIDEKNINYIGIVEQGKKNNKCVTPKSRLKFFNLVEIKSVLLIKDLEKYINQEILLFPIQECDNIDDKEKYLISSINSEKIINYIKKKRPPLVKSINQLLNKINYEENESHSYSIMQQEKDCFQLCLNFTFDSQTKEKIKYKFSDNKGQRFLNCVDNTYDEDSLINHDMSLFGKWQIDHENYTPITRQFKFGNKILRVTNVNRNRQFEKTLGVDLIYYNQYHNSLIMVQYKKWQYENNDYLYRADAQYKEDIKRMIESEEKLKIDETKINFKYDHKYESQRLTDNPFYFKICIPKQDIYSNTLVQGCYLNYTYLETLMKSKKGIRGGEIIYKKDLPNPVSNDLFTDLVKHGLIGCKKINEEQLNIIVNQLLEQGKSITLAETLSTQIEKVQQLSLL